MFSASLKIILSHRVKKDGLSTAMLRITINRKKKLINLKVDCPVKEFDSKKGEWKPQKDNKALANDFNMICRDALAKGNEILVQYRLKRLSLDIDTFLDEFYVKESKYDFLAYMEEKIKERKRIGEITFSTGKHHLVALGHLKTWKKEIPFASFNESWAVKFDQYLKNKTECKKNNSRWGMHRDVKCYLKCAARDKIIFIDPYINFKVKPEMGRFQPLHKQELLDLWYYYHGIEEIKQGYRNVLRAFLFTCFTGLRHADLRLVTVESIDGNFLQLMPKKTERFATRIRVPLTSEALDLVSNEIDEVGLDKMFASVTEQTQNKYIRKIGKKLNINNRLCFQVGRETFATLYMENDGKLEVLASFLGHTTTKMSEKYVKIRDIRKKQEAERISSFLKV